MNKKIDFSIGNEKINKMSQENNMLSKINTARKGRPPGSKSAKKLNTLKLPKTQKGSKGPKGPKPAPKKRGRRPKKILDELKFDENKNLSDESKSKNDSALIVKLRIDPSQLKNAHNKNLLMENSTDDIENENNNNDHINGNGDDNDRIIPDEESSDGMFKNDIPGDNTCNKCIKNEKLLTSLKNKLEKYEKKDQIDKSNKICSNKINFISITSGKKFVLKKTDTWCWWDSHSFTNLPFPLPDSFHNDTFHVMGCFCSVNCALAYNLYHLKDSKIYQRKSLIYNLYKIMYEITPDEDLYIKTAPPREELHVFGGELSIDNFRKSFATINKEYLVYVPPLRPINIIIEERNIETIDDNDKEFVLKRSKPLIKKNRSVISSMKIKTN